MHPILFEIHGTPIYTYGFFMALTVLVVLGLAFRAKQDPGISRSDLVDFIFLLFLSGVAGARLFFAGQHWEDTRENFWGVFNLREGGLVWYGGFLTALASGLLYASFKKWSLGKLADFFAPLLAFGQGLGRIGCFFNGCCYGRLDGFFQHPVQLYESALLFFLSFLLVARKNSKTKRRDGALFIDYIFFYSLLRFCVEFFRGDQVLYGPFSIPQWISLFIFLTAVSIKSWKISNS